MIRSFPRKKLMQATLVNNTLGLNIFAVIFFFLIAPGCWHHRFFCHPSSHQWPAFLIQTISWFPNNPTDGDTFLVIFLFIMALLYQRDHLGSPPRDPRRFHSLLDLSLDWIYFRQMRELWQRSRRLRYHSSAVWPWWCHSFLPQPQFSHLYNEMFSKVIVIFSD